jgi:hypothetical protein
MRGTIYRIVAYVVLGLVGALGPMQAVEACYSGLIIIPTADVTGPYTWALDLQWQGSSRFFKTDQLVLNTELGLGERFEVGIDIDATSSPVERRVLLNAKYVFFNSDKHRFAVAVGVQNMTQQFTPFPFVVATKDWGVLRTHLGIQHERDDNRNNWFVGVDRTFQQKCQVMADYTAGELNFASAGLGWIGDRWQVFLGAQWPNAGGAPLVVLHVNVMGSFRHRSN